MDLFERAAEFAIHAHEGAVRKKEDIPFILHPMEAASIAATMTQDREILAAAMLHDTVEDTDATIEDIERNFGPRVAALVGHETEDKRDGLPRSATWRARKEDSLKVLRESDDPAVTILWISDKLSNMRSFHRQWLVKGDALWNAFNMKDPAQQRWYYESVLELTSSMSHTPAWQELKRLTDIVFGNIK